MLKLTILSLEDFFKEAKLQHKFNTVRIKNYYDSIEQEAYL